jgi:ketosteroid isomerase-like protein
MAILGSVVGSLLALLSPTPADVSEGDRREIVRTLEGLEGEWFQVYETHDLSVLERLIADDFVATLADGAMRGKREHIAAYPADFETLASVTNSELRVRVLTRDVAVATGLYTATLRGKQGPAAVTRYRYTDTWLLRQGSWQCVATHENRLE